MMTKPELVNMVAQNTGMKKSDVSMVIDATLDAIAKSVAQDQQVSLVGFGTFDKRTREARAGRNPRTGEQIQIPASATCVFRPGKRFKEEIGK